MRATGPAPFALVVGAGIGGLAASLALRRAGFLVEVLERNPTLRGEGAGLSLWPNALVALDSLGVGAETRQAGRPQQAGALRNARGTALSTLDPRALAERFGEAITMIERPALHRLLAQAAQAANITLGAEVVAAHLAGAPTVTLADGTQRSADLLIGADGVDSVVRSSLFDPTPPSPSGLVAWRGVADLDEGLEARLTPGECWGGGALFGMTPLAGPRAYWWAAERCSEPPANSAEAEKGALLDRLARWPDPAQALVARTPPPQILRTPLLERPPLRSLVRDRVALLGDAAHPMLPHLGQGGCQALEDAAVLGACLSAAGTDLDLALSRYQGRRLPRTTAVVRRSARLSRIAHLRGPLARARNLLLRALPQAASLRELDDILGWSLSPSPTPAEMAG